MIDWDLVDRMVAERFITARPHHALPLTIYNYTPAAQFDKVWNAATLMCRGLVATQCSDRKVVARPFPKFFNIEEHDQEHLPDLPQESFDVYEKYDGSLFIVSKHDGELVVSTRGSFGSPQAARALKMLKRYGSDWIKDGWTYLFEILYPENRIVVNYGDREDLVFLAAIEIATGREILPPQGHAEAGIPEEIEQAKVYPIGCLEQLQKIEEDNREGFIVRFQSGLRVKIKFEGYKRLHKLITGLSVKAVWEHLSMGDAAALETFKVNVPDEFYDWLTKTEAALQRGYSRILDSHKAVFAKETSDLSNLLTTDRKVAAQRFSAYKKRPETGINPAILFSLMTGKKLDEIVWKQVRPVENRVFKADTDESVNDDQAD
jgi:RNA ligase